MTQAQAAALTFVAFLSRGASSALRNVRFTVVLSLVLICGSFAGAAVVHMRLDRMHALDQAAMFTGRRAGEIASDLSTTFNRYQALGAAFANASESAETGAALSEAGGSALANIAVLDAQGQLVSELKSAPKGFLPLDPVLLAQAASERVVIPSIDGRTMTLAFASNGHIVAMQLNTAALMPNASMEDALLALPDGRLVAMGSQWKQGPPASALALIDSAVNVMVKTPDGNRLVSLRKIPRWPLDAGASIPSGEALSAWYGTLPLYFFFIFGPSLAGAALAVIFVREFERRAKLAHATKTLRSTRPEEARLLVRLAEAERRATEAQRAKSEFIGHMSHELRTPLNAIIGFSEIIERGVFGGAGHPKYVEYAHDIGSAGRALHAKIGDILDFADLDAGRHPIVMKIIDVAALTRASVAGIAGRAFARRIRLIVALPDCSLAAGDAQAVQRILANLLSNATQYTPPGGSVRVQLRTEDGAVIISVRDTGVGFSEGEHTGEAFARFDRPGSVTGTGLGVAVAAALARRMGGSLRIGNAQDNGTLAELQLPRSATQRHAS
ncbi:MAG: HAMP domain-containing sensor histidine kinase [Rhizomicrobium sp.]